MRRKIFSIFMAALMMVSLLAATAFARTESPRVITNGDFTMEKISNPTSEEGEADGLEVGGDRLNSYAWCMEQLGDYIYIGSNRNILYAGTTIIDTQGANVDTLVDLISAGEIQPCDPADLASACIVRYNIRTKQMETWFDSADYQYPSELALIGGFRAAKRFKDTIYMMGMATDVDPVTYETKQSSYIYGITDDAKKPVKVVSNEGGANLRAMNISTDGDTFYVGGTTPPGDGTEDHIGYVVFQNKEGGDHFEKIADFNTEVFKHYQADATYDANPDGDIWDIIEYNGSLYLTLMTPKGAVVFKGYYDPDDTSVFKNEYGWVWTELVGDNGAPYPIGFGNALNYAATPYFYKGDVYFITFSNAMDSLIAGALSMMNYLSGKATIDSYFEALRPCAASIENETSVFRMDTDEKIEMVVGDEHKLPEGSSIEYTGELGAGFNDEEYSTTVYNWRAAVYNDRLYVGTMDAYPIYSYLTRLTNGDLLGMKEDKVRFEVETVGKLLSQITGATAPREETPAEEDQTAVLKASSAVAQGEAEVSENVPAEAFETVEEGEFSEEIISGTAEEIAAAEIIEEGQALRAKEETEAVDDLSGAAFERAEEEEEESETEKLIALAAEAWKENGKTVLDEAAEAPVSEGAEGAEEESEGVLLRADGESLFTEADVNDITENIMFLLGVLDKQATTDSIHQILENKDALAQKLENFSIRLNRLAEASDQKYQIALQSIAGMVQRLAAEIKAANDEGLRRYALISKTLAANKNPGCELYCTEDGISYEAVFLDGLQDRFNYGVRTLLTTDDGLYLGTANPFYGAQLWKITAAEQTCMVTFRDGDTVLRQEEVVCGTTVSAGQTPEKPGDKDHNYSFSGWFSNKELTQEFDFTRPVTEDVDIFAKWTYTPTGGGSSSGGSSGSGAVVAGRGTVTYSQNWFIDASGTWRIRNSAGQIVADTWLCDDAVTANGQNVWYLLGTDGAMIVNGLVQDLTGNFYSLETNHNGYYGMLRYKNGTYDGIYMEFSQKHDGTFGAITNQSAIDALKEKYGVTRFGIGNDRCVYTKSFE